ncbi:hypothetical protein [[Kitasatospora] papulosa]|uniref:hypothetical protein n=1 Tax=[Kitasatospora] papulosa TaxID=1464011 RepID=UPI0036F09623
MSVPPPLAWPDERLSAGAARLASRHQGHFSVETVQQLLTDSYRLLGRRPRRSPDRRRTHHPGRHRRPHRRPPGRPPEPLTDAFRPTC